MLLTLLAILLGFLFVASIYLHKESRIANRNDPDEIKRRLFNTTLTTCLSLVLIQFCAPQLRSDSDLGFLPRRWYNALALPLALTMILFLGPLIYELETFSERFQHCHKWMIFRDIVAAPVLEEVVFRGCVCALLLADGHSDLTAILGSPIIFSLAHAHHLYGKVSVQEIPMEIAVLQVALNLFITALFGTLSAFIFVRTRSLWGVALSHAFCNYMGAPDFSFLHHREHELHAQRVRVFLVYLAGVLAFFWCAAPLTAPHLYV